MKAAINYIFVICEKDGLVEDTVGRQHQCVGRKLGYTFSLRQRFAHNISHGI